ncbi:MAG: NUDIX domain-containing protein [Chlamydiales bacterium]|nr:NUDIX domain-containing protein [Chlamydiales bacterium]
MQNSFQSITMVLIKPFHLVNMQEKCQAVYGIIFDENRSHVLMVKRRDIPVWVLPGGGLDPGESPEKGAIREVFEETGYEVAILRKVAEYLPVNRMTQYTHLFECTILGGSPQTGKETRAVTFYSLDALKDLPPPFANWILDAKACHSHVLRKKIEGVTWFKFFQLLLFHPVLVARYILTKLGIHLNTGK